MFKGLGIFSWFGYVLPVKTRLELIKAAGFDAVTLWWEDEEGEGGNKHRIPDLARNLGLVVENIHVPFERCGDLWSSNKNVQDAIFQQYMSWIQDCQRHDIPVMVMHVTEYTRKSKPSSEGLGVLAKLAEEAEKRGVILAVENTLGQDEFIPTILSELRSPNVGLCFDSSHDRLLAEHPTTLLQAFGNRLAALHLSDNDGEGDRHWLPWEGSIDWNQFARAFPVDYSGYLTLEVLSNQNLAYSQPMDFLVSARNKIIKLRDLLECQKNTCRLKL